MPVPIFSAHTSTQERWLYMNADGTLTYTTERRDGSGHERTVEILSVEEAKTRWPTYCDMIDRARSAAAR